MLNNIMNKEIKNCNDDDKVVMKGKKNNTPCAYNCSTEKKL